MRHSSVTFIDFLKACVCVCHVCIRALEQFPRQSGMVANAPIGVIVLWCVKNILSTTNGVASLL